jgi:hypothetical protein
MLALKLRTPALEPLAGGGSYRVVKAALLVFGIPCVFAFTSGILVSEQSGQTQPTQKQPVFRQAVDLVLVNTFVTDKEGQPVLGLTRADFEVYEGGKPQTIESFQAFQALLSEKVRNPRFSSKGDGGMK